MGCAVSCVVGCAVSCVVGCAISSVAGWVLLLGAVDWAKAMLLTDKAAANNKDFIINLLTRIACPGSARTCLNMVRSEPAPILERDVPGFSSFRRSAGQALSSLSSA
jgi:hypothetical protein